MELGYALVSDKEICLVCSEERTGKYPFDVQHRTITKYRVESKGDFELLKSRITERLKATMEKSATLAAIEAHSPIKESEGLLQHEMIVLCSIVENRRGPGLLSSSSGHIISSDDTGANSFQREIVDRAVLSLKDAGARRLQPGLPIVFASGYADTATFEAVPGATILRKPIQIAELADAVRRTLRNHAA